MPLYVYRCTACNHEFDELVSYEKRDKFQTCKLCGKESERKVAAPFGIKTTLNARTDTIYSPKEIDKVVGADADKKWEGYNEKWRAKYEARQKARWGDRKPEPVNIPKDSDGKFSPIMNLGDKKERKLRKEFSGALQEHRAERQKKGVKQFDGPGAITEG